MEVQPKRIDRWRGRHVLYLLCVISSVFCGVLWRERQSRLREAEATQAEIERLQAESHDLTEFIDEAYGLLKDEGFHVQLELAVDKDGRYRLRASSAELTEELRDKLRELDGQPKTPAGER